ncbi:PLP-dependent aminotransferase family protein [Aneurinibacillus uraniidurans]|uniref:aminotransferase-like domain-containing protein n=1 Tax=Aneurinibacillus uraniidurans TaxID=2966586 RepID=UPI0023495026|nr:PLP-dependent aminotransferase family protein [Aneurinibacillus sp. B1]WCN38812.1 PLP-dependent aminotransferase family protein [Aneurinibacillus sp. B1]
MSIPYFQLRRRSSVPLAEQIAEQLLGAIRTRRLTAGQSLPSVRELAASLGVSMETAQKAYRILKDDGWIESRPRHGTVVSHALPNSLIMLPPKHVEARGGLMEQVRLHRQTPDLIPVSGISPTPADTRFMRAWKQAMGEVFEQTFSQEKADPFGLINLREKIQGMMAGRGMWADVESICMVNGTQQALWLLADQFIKPGDVIGVPEMCYLPARDIFCDRGARIVPLPLGRNGIDIDKLEAVCRKEKLSMLYAMPNAHFPTGMSWPLAIKHQVLALASEYGFSILEDEYFGELYFTPLPPPTLYSLAQEEHIDVDVFYISSFSTMIHPNLRLGYMVTPEKHGPRIRQAKYLLDGTTSVMAQQALLLAWERADFPDYVERLRMMLREARDGAITSLRRWMPERYSFEVPTMGTCTWVYAPPEFDSLRFFERCLARGVYVRPGDAFAVEDPVPGFQVKFGAVEPRILEEGLRRIGEVLMLR